MLREMLDILRANIKEYDNFLNSPEKVGTYVIEVQGVFVSFAESMFGGSPVRPIKMTNNPLQVLSYDKITACSIAANTVNGNNERGKVIKLVDAVETSLNKATALLKELEEK